MYREIGPKMTCDFEDRGAVGNDFLKNFSLFRKSFALTSVFVIQVHFLSNADIFHYGNNYFPDLDFRVLKDKTKIKIYLLLTQ